MVDLCKSKAAHEVIPKKQLRLDLAEVEKKIRDLGWNIKMNARVVLMAESGCDISIFPSGKLLLKTMERTLAEKLAAEFGDHFYR